MKIGILKIEKEESSLIASSAFEKPLAFASFLTKRNVQSKLFCIHKNNFSIDKINIYDFDCLVLFGNISEEVLEFVNLKNTVLVPNNVIDVEYYLMMGVDLVCEENIDFEHLWEAIITLCSPFCPFYDHLKGTSFKNAKGEITKTESIDFEEDLCIVNEAIDIVQRDFTIITDTLQKEIALQIKKVIFKQDDRFWINRKNKVTELIISNIGNFQFLCFEELDFKSLLKNEFYILSKSKKNKEHINLASLIELYFDSNFIKKLFLKRKIKRALGL